jgi:hypothetical protein
LFDVVVDVVEEDEESVVEEEDEEVVEEESIGVYLYQVRLPG